jgi:hypothetical protein
MLGHLLDSTRKLCCEESAKRVTSFQVSVQSLPKRPVFYMAHLNWAKNG